MIGTYIQELLATNNRVIIPNYGAFLVRATSKSKDSNTLEEKLADIYFSPFLKFNDELLEKHIIKKEGVTKEQAAEKIKQFIDDIKKELDQEKPYKIEGFGEFTADKQGKVIFTTVAKGKEVKKEETKPKPAEKRTTTAKTTAKTTSAAKAKATVKDEKKEEKASTPAKEEKPAPAASKKEEDKKTDLKEFKPEEKKEEKTKQVEKPIYSYKKEKKPVNKGLIWTIAISVPVAAIFVWGILNFNTVKKVFLKDKVKTEKVVKKKTTDKKQVTKKAAEVKAKTKSEEEKKQVEQKEKVAEKKKPVTPQKKYYIIAGSFKNESYANSYLNKLKGEGYNAEKLAERNGMYAVSFSSFTDKRKAIAEYKFITQEKGLQAWILYY